MDLSASGTFSRYDFLRFRLSPEPGESHNTSSNRIYGWRPRQQCTVQQAQSTKLRGWRKKWTAFDFSYRRKHEGNSVTMGSKYKITDDKKQAWLNGTVSTKDDVKVKRPESGRSILIVSFFKFTGYLTSIPSPNQRKETSKLSGILPNACQMFSLLWATSSETQG